MTGRERAAHVRSEVERLAPWHYEFDLDGVHTPIRLEGHRHRHAKRKALFWSALEDACGGSLEGKRVLDLGCNAGYWSLAAIESGCAFVQGVDSRSRHIEQAQLVFETMGVPEDRYRFDVADAAAFLAAGKHWDVILCLGLLYHLESPLGLLRGIRSASPSVVFLETKISLKEGRCFEVHFEGPDRLSDSAVVLVPTREALTSVGDHLGFQMIELPVKLSDYEGMRDFQRGERAAFLCVAAPDAGSTS